MYGVCNVKFVNVQQTKAIFSYKNTKLYRNNAGIWFDKICEIEKLTPKYMQIKI